MAPGVFPDYELPDHANTMPARSASTALSTAEPAHARDTGHPIMRSAEPGEDWSYFYLDDIAFVLNR